MTDGFQRGAGVPISVSGDLFSGFLVICLIIAAIVVVIGAFKGWSDGSISFESMRSYVIRAVLFFVVVCILLIT